MNLFEFLMILLSLIVGFGLAEILSGVAGILKREGIGGFSWTHSASLVVVFVALLQTFWESWGLGVVEEWSFPAMLLMLGSPVLLFLISHVIVPDQGRSVNLEDYYFERASMIWVLAGLTVVVGTLFRPIAFGMPLWVTDNASALPTLGVCILLGVTKTRLVHRVLVPVVLIFVLLDTLTVSYTIS